MAWEWVAPVATGVVGVVGVVGTLTATRLQFWAQDAQNAKSEKRRLYAEYLKSADELIWASYAAFNQGDWPTEDHNRFESSRKLFILAKEGAVLIAGYRTAELMAKEGRAILDNSSAVLAGQLPKKYPILQAALPYRGDLLRSMRAELVPSRRHRELPVEVMKGFDLAGIEFETPRYLNQEKLDAWKAEHFKDTPEVAALKAEGIIKKSGLLDGFYEPLPDETPQHSADRTDDHGPTAN